MGCLRTFPSDSVPRYPPAGQRSRWPPSNTNTNTDTLTDTLTLALWL